MPGNRPSPHQQAFLDAVRAAGGLAVVITSLDDLDAALAEALDGRRRDRGEAQA